MDALPAGGRQTIIQLGVQRTYVHKLNVTLEKRIGWPSCPIFALNAAIWLVPDQPRGSATPEHGQIGQ